MKNIKLIEVKSEIGAGTRGASMGIDAIKIAALDFGSSYFKKYKSVEILNENKLLLEPIQHEHAKRIKGVYTVVEKLSKEVEKTMKQENVFPIVLAGDHSTAAGTITGIKMAYPEKRLGVIWIDAHADIHSPYTTPSGNMHGMPIAMLTAEDNMEFKVNNPDAESVEYWEKLKSIGNIKPKILFSDLIFIGVRDTEKQEEELMRKKNIRNFTVAEIRRKGVERVAIEALNLLEKCDLIYVSFDVDSMDSAISKGTGTPVKNGITEKEAGNLIARLFYSKKLCCFEIVEVNPTLDKENLMAENAFEILLKATNQLNRDF